MRLFLLGFMGTGKSYWGRQWAEKYEISFYDLDEVIEKAEGRSINEIFEKSGEDFFRQKEAIVLRSMSEADNCIIACGGGTPCFFNNLKWMNENGTTISIIADKDYILDNVIKEKGKRPLIKDVNEAELLFFIEKKLKERMPFYTAANIILNATDINIHSLDSVMHRNL